jgi:HEAT repeat protein
MKSTAIGLSLLLSVCAASRSSIAQEKCLPCDAESTGDIHVFAEPGISVSGYIDRLEHGTSEWQRYNAAAALGELGDKTAVPALMDALGSSSEWVRTNAVQALGALNATEAVPRLQLLTMDPSADVRAAARQAIDDLAPTKSKDK